MRLNMNYKIGIAILTCVLISALSEDCFAVFNLSVRPYEGGYDLNYGKIDAIKGRVNKEVNVDIDSDISTQYRLTQILQQPLVNARGVTLPRGSFTVYGIRGTNKYGTLGVEQEMPIGFGRSILYTSNQQGLPDSFNLVYGFSLTGDIEPGFYRGTIRFTLEPIQSVQTPITVLLNVLMDIEVESTIKITPQAGISTIVLKSRGEEANSSDVAVEIKGTAGKQVRIYQEVSVPLTSPDGERLPYEAVDFKIIGARRGTGPTTPTPLSSQRQLIYTSGLRGEAESFLITYNLADLEGQDAGRYRTRIRYFLEGIKTGLITTLDLEVENSRIFDLLVTPTIGGDLIQFRNLKPRQPPRQKEVDLKIITNIGKLYQVSQRITNPLSSRAGQIIPEEYFTLRTESSQTRGTLKYPSKTAIKTGEMVLFISNVQGDSDQFRVIYGLTVPPQQVYGDYSTRIIYSLSEI